MTTDLSPEEREALKIAMHAEINAAFERGTSGGPERVFEAGWLAAREYSKQREQHPSGCPPCADCGTDYAAQCSWWVVEDDLWQSVVGVDPTVVLCPSCFAKRAALREEKLREALRTARRRIRQVHELDESVRPRRLREITTDAICEIDDALAENRAAKDTRPWRWRGMAGHLIVASRCCFHMTTDIGDYRVSTVGCYHPRGRGEGERETIGADRLYETMVFRIGQNDEIDPSELGFEGYNDEGDAERGHVRMCERWGAGKPAEKADSDER